MFHGPTPLEEGLFTILVTIHVGPPGQSPRSPTSGWRQVLGRLETRGKSIRPRCIWRPGKVETDGMCWLIFGRLFWGQFGCWFCKWWIPLVFWYWYVLLVNPLVDITGNVLMISKMSGGETMNSNPSLLILEWWYCWIKILHQIGMNSSPEIVRHFSNFVHQQWDSVVILDGILGSESQAPFDPTNSRVKGSYDIPLPSFFSCSDAVDHWITLMSLSLTILFPTWKKTTRNIMWKNIRHQHQAAFSRVLQRKHLRSTSCAASTLKVRSLSRQKCSWSIAMKKLEDLWW